MKQCKLRKKRPLRKNESLVVRSCLQRQFWYGKPIGTFRSKPPSNTYLEATIQETLRRATLHLLHWYPCIPCILLCCISQRRSMSLTSAFSEASCVWLECHAKLTGFVVNLSFRTSVLLRDILLNDRVVKPGRCGFQSRTESDRNQLQ